MICKVFKSYQFSSHDVTFSYNQQVHGPFMQERRGHEIAKLNLTLTHSCGNFPTYFSCRSGPLFQITIKFWMQGLDSFKDFQEACNHGGLINMFLPKNPWNVKLSHPALVAFSLKGVTSVLGIQNFTVSCSLNQCFIFFKGHIWLNFITLFFRRYEKINLLYSVSPLKEGYVKQTWH